jgi:cytochrome b
MIVVLLLAITALASTGVVVLGGVLKAGPLTFATSFATGWQVREVHKLLAFVLLGLIGMHVAGAVFESRRTHENLVRAMIDGKKEARHADHASVPRKAQPLLATTLASGLLAASAGAIWSLASRPGLGVPTAALDPTYAKECSACHVAYHPSLLPRASWTALMANLENHFGENASLDTTTTATISSYLQENAAETYDTKPANRLRQVDAEKPFTIIAAPFWKRIHGSIPEAIFMSMAVGGRGNCEACHVDARTGRFYPGAIHIPAEKRP